MMNKKELAEALSISVSMVDKLLTQGLPHYKIGKSVRFELQEVKEWLKGRK